MKKKIKPWEKWNLDARKTKDRVMRKLCSNCKRPFSESGVSAYPGLCKRCVEK